MSTISWDYIDPAEMEQLEQQVWRAYDTSNQEFAKQKRYCQAQREVLRALEDLAAREEQMYELDHAKDQVMTVCKVAVTNLVLWTRITISRRPMPTRPGNGWSPSSS